MIDFEHITWTCHICGELRLNEYISVYTTTLPGLYEIKVNIRYCNDRPDCIAKAKDFALNGLPLKS